jgi:hypothetical protein
MAMNDWNIQGATSLSPNDVSEAIHTRQIHDNLPLEVVEGIIMIFYLLQLVKWKNEWNVTSTDGNEW